MSDRGMKKWAAYASLIEQKGTIVRMKQSKARIEKPHVSQDQAAIINANLLIAKGQVGLVVYFKDGIKITEKGIIKQINFDEKWLKINEKTINFSSLLDIQIQSPINPSTSLLNK
jgi:uncharacterized protein YkvS